MKIALISVTEKGRKLSLEISQLFKHHEIKRFCFHTHADKECEPFDDIKKTAEEAFLEYKAIVFVCACGIAVRAIAPFVSSKLTDPAVIVIDDCSKFVIPILSGHLGGANKIACEIAFLINAQAVITTATDIGGKFSPDSFAQANGLIISDMDMAKLIASKVLEEEKIGLVSEYPCINIPSCLSRDEHSDAGIYIGGDNNKSPFEKTLWLIPKNIVLGIGCKKGLSCEDIEKTVFSALKDNRISMERVCAVSSIDLKKSEKGLCDFCQKYGLSLYTYSSEELMETEGDFSVSDYVKKVTGADNVCERSCVKHSGGKLILKKYAQNGVTVAAAEKPIKIDFERKQSYAVCSGYRPGEA